MTNPYTATNHGTMDSMLPGMDDQNHCCHCGHDLGTPPIEDKPGIHGPDSLYYDPDALGEVAERRPPQ